MGKPSSFRAWITGKAEPEREDGRPRGVPFLLEGLVSVFGRDPDPEGELLPSETGDVISLLIRQDLVVTDPEQFLTGLQREVPYLSGPSDDPTDAYSHGYLLASHIQSSVDSTLSALSGTRLVGGITHALLHESGLSGNQLSELARDGETFDVVGIEIGQTFTGD